MIVTSPEAFTQAWLKLPLGHGRPTMRAAMLVMDDAFVVAPETKDDNVYLNLHSTVDCERALAQQFGVQQALLRCGVPTVIFPILADAHDGIFCNNAFATTAGRLLLGSMRHAIRQREPARIDVRAFFAELLGYELCDLAKRDVIAELTGPLVIDRSRLVGFCGMSSRVDVAGCSAMHEAFGLNLTFRFDLAASEYHTNVVLAVLAGRACVLHSESLVDREVGKVIANAYAGATLLLNDDEKAAFAGNCIAITAHDVLMSETAAAALRPQSRIFFERVGFRLHAVAVDELEKAGGSLRCMVSEIF